MASCLGLPLAVTGFGYLPTAWISHSTLLMLYLMVVLFCARYTDRRGVLVSSVLGFLLFNFFHTQPRYSLWMHDVSELTAALAYIFFALLAGGLAHRLQRQVHLLRFQERFLTAQLELMQSLSLNQPITELESLVKAFSARVFDGRVTLHLIPAQVDPVTGARAVRSEIHSGLPLPATWQTLIRSLGEQVQAALDRNTANRELKQAERRADEEGLRNALLSSVSHDLKTPLVTMMGSATSLRELDADLSDRDRSELLDSIIDESRRLERYIQNLLDMTRLGHGELSLNRQWISVEELYHVVVRRLEQTDPAHNIYLEVEGEIPSLWVHAALVEQALFNALDNAIKASPDNGCISIKAERQDNRLILDICDQGEGVPVSQWEAVFEQFYSFSQGDRYTKGSGLGLTICKGMMRVHGGDAEIVQAPEGYGHCLRLSLPLTGIAGLDAKGGPG